MFDMGDVLGELGLLRHARLSAYASTEIFSPRRSVFVGAQTGFLNRLVASTGYAHLSTCVACALSVSLLGMFCIAGSINQCTTHIRTYVMH